MAIVSIVFFAPASFFLGMVSPYAIKIKIVELSKTGTVAGNLYAISTTGSIVGTFLAGFFIIPNFGSTNTLIILVLVLFILAIFLSGNAKKIGEEFAKRNLENNSCVLFGGETTVEIKGEGEGGKM